MKWLSRFAIRCIEYYQLKGGGEELLNVECNYIPSCSQYAKVSIHRFGFYHGGFLAFKRICSCHHPDLVHQIEDPVPDILIKK